MNTKKYNYEIIIQAGGKGSRLRHFTWNKPKCLVSFKGKPIIYHLFDKFVNSNFHIIGDYQLDKIKRYFLISPPKVKYTIYKTKNSGTCSGIKDVLKNINNNKKIILIWGDLIINQFPSQTNDTTIFTTSSFTCRWSVQGKQLREITSSKKGIPGVFFFKNKNYLKRIPESGEFVKWLSHNLKNFKIKEIKSLKELGDFDTIEKSYNEIGYGRFFNKISIKDKVVTKKALIKDYEKLIINEQHWYSEVLKLGFKNIPKIISKKPFQMEKINGSHVFDFKDLNKSKTFKIIENTLVSLSNLHERKKIKSNIKDIEEVYINKTIDRLASVSKIIPNFSSAQTFTINGKKCKNYFYKNNKNKIIELKKLLNTNFFYPIHGDPTFSNFLIKKNFQPVFFDPRGYFFKEKDIHGDKNYDFAKLYYSAVGNYDFFNKRKFKLYINNNNIEILMDNILQHDVNIIFKDYLKKDFQKIRILHGLIWLSLSGYVKDDIDSILASFYNGLYWLNKVLD